ncbi:voltage-gated potassium channel [Lucifera butyrica]|uniref:Voltage-gated potassium channel n=1 Tax=Lucifera butyrica TaxID=1351585 RepID=A0A498RD56_9FIRM|nr:potassium channel family protein [Lucifera butyrica]VBB09391.1 voltage-gated potassium channel [Lucifera butyrica]
MNQFINVFLRLIRNNYLAKPVLITSTSVVVSYYFPDLTAEIVRKDIPRVLFHKAANLPLSVYTQLSIFFILAILLASCLMAFYGVWGLVRYIMARNHQGKRKIILILVTYVYMIVAFANTYYLITYVTDFLDSLYKYRIYYEISQNQELKNLMIEKEMRVRDFSSFSGFHDRFWSGVDTKDAVQLWMPDSYRQVPDPVPVAFIFKALNYRPPQVIHYLGGNKLSVYTDCVYFSTTTITTLGYGDIAPQSGLSKLLVSLEAVLGQVLLALGIASAFSGIPAVRHFIKTVPRPKKDR